MSALRHPWPSTLVNVCSKTETRCISVSLHGRCRGPLMSGGRQSKECGSQNTGPHSMRCKPSKVECCRSTVAQTERQSTHCSAWSNASLSVHLSGVGSCCAGASVIRTCVLSSLFMSPLSGADFSSFFRLVSSRVRRQAQLA